MKNINTKVINSYKFFLFISGYLLICVCVCAFLALVLHAQFPIYCVFLVFAFITPAILQKQFRKKFTSKVSVDLTDNYLSFEFTNAQGEKFNQKRISMEEINSFKIWESSRDDTSVLRLVLTSGEKIKYTFVEQRGKYDVNVTKMIFDIFREYNKSHAVKISLMPNFFATRKGLVSVILLSVLLAISIGVQLAFKPKSIPATFITGLLLYAIIIMQRQQDVKQQKEWNEIQ